MYLEDLGIQWPEAGKLLDGTVRGVELEDIFKNSKIMESVLDSWKSSAWELKMNFFRHKGRCDYSVSLFINKETGEVSTGNALRF